MKRILLPLLLLCTTLSYADPGSRVFDSQGLGPVKLGTNVRRLPKTSEGFYDSITSLNDKEATEYVVKFKGERVATVLAEKGKVRTIRIFSDKYSTGAGLGCHSTAAQILDAGGKAYCDNSGYVGLLCDGVLYQGMKLSASGQKKAENAYLYGTDQTFTKADFVKGAHPDIIILDSFFASEAQPADSPVKEGRQSASIPGWLYWLFLGLALVLTGAVTSVIREGRIAGSWKWKLPLFLLYTSIVAFFCVLALDGSSGGMTPESPWKAFFKIGGYCALVTGCLYLIIEARVRVHAPAFCDWLESICMLACTVVFWGLLIHAARIVDFVPKAYAWGMGLFGKKITFVATLLTVIIIPALLQAFFMFVIFPLSAPGGRLYLVLAQIVLLLPVFTGSFSALGEFASTAKFLPKAIVYIVHVCAYMAMIGQSYKYLITKKCPYCHSMAHSHTTSIVEGAPVITHSSGSNTEEEVNERYREIETITTTTHYNSTTVQENQIHSMHCSRCGFDWDERIFTKEHHSSTPTSKEIETETIRW